MINAARYARGVQVAVQFHHGQLRKGTAIPYVSHPLAVSALVLEHGGDEDQAIAGLLHDTVEDCGARMKGIEVRFGADVAGIVRDCTDGVPGPNGRKASWHARKQAHIAHMAEVSDRSLLVIGCDKLHNLRSVGSDYALHGRATLDRFTGGLDGVIWYYGELEVVVRTRFMHSALAQEMTVALARVVELSNTGW